MRPRSVSTPSVSTLRALFSCLASPLNDEYDPMNQTEPRTPCHHPGEPAQTARPTLYTASPTRASPLGLLDQRAPVLGVIYNPSLPRPPPHRRARRRAPTCTPAPAPPTTTHSATATLPSHSASLLVLASPLVAVEWGSDRAPDPIRRKAGSFARRRTASWRTRCAPSRAARSTLRLSHRARWTCIGASGGVSGLLSPHFFFLLRGR
ncbi:hypothetical protein BC826DRAFT_718035 [Russula brevipes]|nr:hypothetical protein BC826DRAFT_718035 [Russula brevipes]